MHKKIAKSLSRDFRSCRGNAVVETAILLPFLLLFLIGLMEMGVLLHDKSIITNASREGARYAVAGVGGPVTDAEVGQWVSDYIGNRLISFSSASSSTAVTRSGNLPGSSIRVQVTYPYSFLVLPNLYQTTLDSSLTIGAETTMRME